ncbi:hypothetical protein C2G38_2222370 [Gigaspora rosea]|uniref:Uncharacterized protein n=1 Tax=Gigaspora rosea TaxID=44941 RepID=A0A397U5W2_9GLOM|nr:hypothetical protein C2G38_2222370 [Gigaspora rosea]
MVNSCNGKTKYAIPKIVQEKKRELLARKLTMALSESGTTDYGTQELQSLISSCLENYIYEKKEKLDISKESGSIKKPILEIRTLSSIKEVELQSEVTQETAKEIHKAKSLNLTADSKTVQTSKEEDPFLMLEKEISPLEDSNIRERSIKKKENHFDFTI